jgi:hypothetical protein
VLEALPDVVSGLPRDVHLCLIDAYVHVFFTEEERDGFREQVMRLGRDLDWISLDPLVPMGAEPRRSVQAAPLPRGLLDRAKAEGVWGVLGRLAVRDGDAAAEVLALGHPGGEWLEWLR